MFYFKVFPDNLSFMGQFKTKVSEGQGWDRHCFFKIKDEYKTLDITTISDKHFNELMQDILKSVECHHDMVILNIGDLQGYKQLHGHVVKGDVTSDYWSVTNELTTKSFDQIKQVGSKSYLAFQVDGTRSKNDKFTNNPMVEKDLFVLDITKEVVDKNNKIDREKLVKELAYITSELQPSRAEWGTLILFPMADGYKVCYLVKEAPEFFIGDGVASVSDIALAEQNSLPRTKVDKAKIAVGLGSSWKTEVDGKGDAKVSINGLSKLVVNELAVLYKAGKVEKIGLSGANGHKDKDGNVVVSEMDTMKEYALTLGIPEKDILLDDSGANSTDLQAKSIPEFAKKLYPNSNNPYKDINRDGGVVVVDISTHSLRTQQEFDIQYKKREKKGQAVEFLIFPVHGYDCQTGAAANQHPFEKGLNGYIAYEKMLRSWWGRLIAKVLKWLMNNPVTGSIINVLLRMLKNNS